MALFCADPPSPSPVSPQGKAPQATQVPVDEMPSSAILTIGVPQSMSKEGRLFVSGTTPFSLASTDQVGGIGQIEYRLDGNVWLTYQKPFMIADEGDHKVEYRGADRTGNLGAVRTIQVTVDNTPPITTLSANSQTPDSSDAIMINRPVTVTLDSYDILSGVNSTEYRVDQGKWTRYNAPFRVDGNAPHTIYFHSADNAGNQERIKTVQVKIDRSPPVSGITMGEPHITTSGGASVVSEITFFTISAKDALSGVEKTEYRIDKGEWQRYRPFNIQTEGRHRIEFRSTDRAGNIESPRHLDLTVVTTPPSTRISVNNKPSESGSVISSILPLPVSLSAKDAGAGIKATEYRLDGGQWAPFKPFTVSDEGEHIVEARSIDRLGNVETTRFVKLLIDRTPPQTELVIGEPKRIENGIPHITDKTVISLSASDSLSGVSRSQYVIEGTSELYGSEPFSIVSGGEYRIRYWSTDRMGNREKEHQLSVIVDLPKPAVKTGMTAVSKPVASEADGKKQADSAPPGPASKPVELQGKKEPAADQTVPNALMLDPFFNKAARGAPETIDPEQNKKFFTTGGINAAIIAIIMLIL